MHGIIFHFVQTVCDLLMIAFSLAEAKFSSVSTAFGMKYVILKLEA